MTYHDVTARRRPDGWQRWYAKCDTCGWTAQATSREHAEDLADEHHAEAEAKRCTCWDAESMEFAPEPCKACREAS